MPEIKRFECDCGCGTVAEPWQAEGWFALSQTDARAENFVRLHKHRALCFVDLEHLNRWMKRALPKARELQEALRHAPYPRGLYVKEDVSLCI